VRVYEEAVLIDHDEDPRIETVTAELPTTVHITWKDGRADTVELAGWLAENRTVLGALRDPEIFVKPRSAVFDSAVEWGEPDGDLVIDAHHLRLLAMEQRPFRADDLMAWQKRTGMSNHETSGFLNIAVSTYGRWKSGEAEIPQVVAMVCRASLRDPVMIAA
ncbi:Uncharacterized protein APZ42_003084, partial [Daphnia magna]